MAPAPSVVLGYMENQEARDETFSEGADGRWVRTGDVGLMTKVFFGNEQHVVVDRITEMIKVMVCAPLHKAATRIL